MIHIINIQIVIIISREENDLNIRVDPKQVIGQSDPGLITKLDIDESQIIVLAFCSKKQFIRIRENIRACHDGIK